MDPLITTWILWAFINTANPNVNGFIVLDEHPTFDVCMTVAKQTAIELSQNKEINEEIFATGGKLNLICIPALTRTTTDATEPLLQLLPRANHKRTAIG